MESIFPESGLGNYGKTGEASGRVGVDKPLVRAALAVSGRRAGGKIHVAPAIPGSLQSGRGKPELISQPIVFVVGAGASAEFNLPAGGAMKEKIAHALNFKTKDGSIIGDREFLDVLKFKFKTEIRKYYEAAITLSSRIGEFDSIDEALHWFSTNAEVVLLGKIAIVREILKAERASTIFSLVEANGTPKGYELAWVPPFLQLAVGSIKREDIGSAFRNVTVINFNYDRTIEHFLHSRLQSSFDIPADEAKAVVANLKMIRPYGSVGLLPWQDGSDTVPFGAELSIDFDKLSALSKNVRTFTEQNLTDELKSEITSAIDSSRVVVFLGFGFHQQNMTLLKAGRTNPDWYRRVLATVLNVDPENRDNLQTHIARTLACNDPRVVQLLPWHSHRLLLGMKPTLQAALNN